jgi:hypothetical protein
LGARATLGVKSGSMSVTEVRCQHCGGAAGEAPAFCRHCGRPLSGKQMGRGAENDIYLMLVTANVLRLRRQWRLAEAKCSEVLRREPESAEAYSLLGDISRDQGKLRDAIEWYKLALDRNPGNEADRKKLEAVIDEVFSGRGEGLVSNAGAKLKQGLGGLTADVRGARIPSSVLVVLAAALGIIVVVAVWVVVAGRGGEPAGGRANRDTPSGAFAVADPEGVTRTMDPEQAGNAARAVENGVWPDVAQVESELLSHLQTRVRAIDPNCKVESVEVEPETRVARLWLSMPRVWGGRATRAGVERPALALAGEAARWDERLQTLRVRCDMRGTDGTRQMALKAEGSAATVAKAGQGMGGRMEDFFDSVWWHPELRN